MPESPEKIIRSDVEWKQILTPEQYEVLREKGTEPPGSGIYEHETAHGMYRCAACGNPLFQSETKFDAGCGWPSFFAPIDSANVDLRSDTSHGMVRTEVICSKCGSHLGHLFDDGPQPTGQRYCINSISLSLKKDT